MIPYRRPTAGSPMSRTGRVRFVGGPKDGEFLTVRLDSRIAFPVIRDEQYTPGADLDPDGPAYEMVEYRLETFAALKQEAMREPTYPFDSRVIEYCDEWAMWPVYVAVSCVEKADR